jgi:hypothetical protein
MRLPTQVRILGIALSALGALHGTASAQLTEEQSPGLRVVYVDTTESYLVPHATRTTLNSLNFQKKLFGFSPSDDLTVLLLDLSDSGNAGATSVPRDLVRVQIAPLGFTFETLAANERLNTIMNHELVHVATMDQGAGRDRLFRGFFRGKVLPISEQPESVPYFYLTSPRVAAPRWYHEGIAVFVDTWMAGGLGRAQSGYDEMVFRAMVKDHAPFYDPLGLVSEGTKVDFQLEINSYVYGTRFMTWLARRYSPEQLIEWTSRHDGSRAYYASQFRHVFGMSLGAAWSSWIEDEKSFQEANLAAIRKNPVTPYRDITSRALGSVSRAFFDSKTNKLFAAFNYPGVIAHVGAIDVETGAVERIVPIKGPVIYTVTSLAWNPDDRALFYTTDNNAMRDLVRLDPTTGATVELQKDARIGDLAYNRGDRSLWGIRHLNGFCTIVRIPAPYMAWEQIITLPYGTIVYDLDVSPDGTRLSASFGEITGKQDVRVLNIEALKRGETTPEARFDVAQSVPNGFTFSPDGRYLYGSAYVTGVSNVFRYDLSTGQLEAVSNTETGFFRPVPLGDDALYVFRYTGAGFVPTRIDAKPIEDVSAITFLGERLIAEHPVLQQWNVGSPLSIQYEALQKKQEPYGVLSRLGLESWFPIVQGYKDSAAIGARVNLSDPVGLNRASLSASYSPAGDLPATERVHLAAEYERYDWRGRVELNNADFYDLVGPTKTSRKGYVASLGRSHTFLFDDPRRLALDLDASLSGNLDQLPEYQNVPVDITHLGEFEAKLGYRDLRSSLGNVDVETGVAWNAVAQASLVDRAFVARFRADYDRGLALPLPHSSIWFRESGGFSPQNPAQPFANFFFGGFGNNYVDHGAEKRYREYYSLPGAELNEIGGRNFLKSMVEVNLPPLRFLHVGSPGFFIPWMRPAVFVTGLATNLDDASTRHVVFNGGGQLDFHVSMMSALDLTLSIGGAMAFENGEAPRREVMISLKVLR